MRIISRLLVMIAAAGAGLAVGLAWRAKHFPEPPNTAAVSAPWPDGSRPKPPRMWNRRVPFRLHDDSPLATQLERDLSMSSGVTRWLYWLEALEKAAPIDFPRLARLAQGNPTATRFVAARWAEVAPRHLFDTLMAARKGGGVYASQELAGLLFEEWPKRDPEAAIAALSDPATPNDWRWEVAYAVVERDIERGLRLMVEWHVDDVGFGPRGLAAAAKWTRADPRHAAEFMSGLPNAHSFSSAMETVGKEWAKIDPAAALAFATSRRGELVPVLATSALQEWAERNLSEAAEWLGNADRSTRHRLSPTLVEEWAKQEAGSALAWCQGNLSGSALAQAVGGVLKGAAEKDVFAAAGLVAGLNPSPARAEAAVAVALKWFPQLSAGVSTSPEAVAWLAGLDADSIKRVLDRVTWGWATSDPRSMAAFLAGATSGQVPSHAYTVVARELARQAPSAALEWASLLPAEPALAAGGAAFAGWGFSQPEAAMSWLNDLPAADPRRPAYFEGLIRSIAYHPQAADRLAAMSVTERAQARSVIATMALSEDRRATLLEALQAR